MSTVRNLLPGDSRTSAKQSVFFLLILLLQAKAIVADERPNILFIYTDDQSHRTVGCYPNAFDWVETPNIDALARQGVRFDHAYIGSWCMPSRATMLTGMHQHGIESMRMDGKYPRSLYDPAECPFWPKVFRENGYTTAQIGKWHTGIDAGFGRDWDYQIVWNRPLHPGNAPNYYDNQLTSFQGQTPRIVEGYTTDNYTDWAIEFIEGKGRAEDKPWYLWLCYGAVHGPFTPADRHLDDYPNVDVPEPPSIYPPRAGKPKYVQEMEYWEKGKQGQAVERKARDNAPVGMKDFPGRSLRDWVRQYHQGVKAIDENLGRLLETLIASGQDENTLIVFTSDQGFAWGQHGFKSKVAPYRATVEAPLIIRPAKDLAAKCAGSVVKEPVSGVDLPPTFFAQAGIELPWKMHGHDLTPVLEDPEQKWPYSAMLVHTGRKYGSETAQVPEPDDPDLYHGPGVPWYIMLSQGEYKYIRNLVRDETEELYDIRADPDELNNLALEPKYDDLLERFRAAMETELRRTDAELVENMPSHGTLQRREANAGN
ncbi:MAG: sulfatase-like hydrolase/transferase [Planctomycetota bacterium]